MSLLLNFNCDLALTRLSLFLGAVGWSVCCECGIPGHIHFLIQTALVYFVPILKSKLYRAVMTRVIYIY